MEAEMKMYHALAAVAAAGMIFGGCAIAPIHNDDPSMGALMGATAGAVIGHQYGRGGRDKGALIGGVLGYTAGKFYEQNERQNRQAYRNDYYPPQRESGYYDDHRSPAGHYYPENRGHHDCRNHY